MYMARLFQLSKKQQAGFTIVELLIVIVVIAILAAISVVAYNGIQGRAQASAASSALAQAVKKIALAQVDTPGVSPDCTTFFGLIAAGSTPSCTGSAPATSGALTTNGIAYQYKQTDTGAGYCVTATNGKTSYTVSNTNTIPYAGGCPGHGQGGADPVTNYYFDPKPVGTGYVSVWDGANTGMVVSNVSASWSSSGRAVRATFPGTIVNASNGGPTPSLRTAYAPYVNTRYTIAASVRLIAGEARVGTISIDRDSNLGTITQHSNTGGNYTMSINDVRRVSATFTADSAATTANMRLYVQIANKIPNTTIEIADIDLYPGDYDSSRVWASGDSPNWVWNGAPNSSTSTGPAL
jgi:prepilin-type N-terminal cleavage/methylation domain-containing protein